MVQTGIGLTLLIFGQVVGDSACTFASFWTLSGTIPWVSLVLLFHQHRLERIESLETDELAAAHDNPQSVFEAAEAEGKAAARRLRLMHGALVPAASLVYAALLGLGSWWILGFLQVVAAAAPVGSGAPLDSAVFGIGSASGWQMAICLGLALGAFIFSRFVAGMAQQAAWQNLRGGAGVMVGNALVMTAVAVGVVFGVFQRPAVLQGITYGLGIFMAVAGSEVVLNFILNLYRPRRSGETPRPAFDSKVLGLLAAPDSIVRSINEAVNYQFGFDITSSWGYQLVLRSAAYLLALGAVVLICLTTVVVLEPGVQALRLRGGQITGEAAESSLLFKLPWPFETIESFDVARIRSIPLGPVASEPQRVNLWPIESKEGGGDRRAFIVSAPSIAAEVARDLRADPLLSGADQPADSTVSNKFALVDVEVILRYRIRSDSLRDWLSFASDQPSRRGPDMRERTLKALALREVSQLLAMTGFDQVLSPRGDSMVKELRERIQKSFDRVKSGVEVVGIDIPTLRPPPEAAMMFEERSIDIENSRKVVEEAQRIENTTMAAIVGGVPTAMAAVAGIDELHRLERLEGVASAAAQAQRAKVEGLLLEARAQSASVIGAARAKRWELQMKARRTASLVMGQSASYHTAPELYRQRAIMQVMAHTLAGVRSKYVLGVDPERTRFDVQMQQPDPGLNLADYLERKTDNNGSK